MYRKWMRPLLKCPLFDSMDVAQLNGMLECIRPRIFKYVKDEIIALGGDKFQGIGIVLDGQVLITKDNAGGNRVIITKMRAGDLFGEMAAFSGETRWPATIVCQESCHLIFIPPNAVVNQCEKLCVSHQLLITNMLKIISKKALILNRRVEYLSIRSISGKISYFLLEQYNDRKKKVFNIDLNRRELADFLNIPRPSLSREMCKMRDQGIIDFNRSLIEIKKLDKLKSLANC